MTRSPADSLSPPDDSEVLAALARTEIPMPALLAERVQRALHDRPPAPARVEGLDAAIERDADEGYSLLVALLGDEEAAWQALVEGFVRLGRGPLAGLSRGDVLRALSEAGLEVARLLRKRKLSSDPGALAPASRLALLLEVGLGEPGAAPVQVDLVDALVSAYPCAADPALATLLTRELLGRLTPAEERELAQRCAEHPTSAALLRERYAEASEVPPLVLARREELRGRVADQLARESERAGRIEELRVQVSVRCTYCHGGLERSQAAFCAACLAPHHTDCFREHGRCSAPGCEACELVRPEAAPQRVTRRALPRRGLLIALGALALGVGSVAALSSDAGRSLTHSPHDAPGSGLEFGPGAQDERAAAPPTDPRLLAEARAHIAAQAALSQAEQAALAAFAERLASRKITVDFDATPFPECLDRLRLKTGLNFALTADARQVIEEDPFLVDLRLDQASARDVLELVLLHNDSLTYSLGEGVVRIRSTSDPAGPLRVEAYEVSDLVAAPLAGEQLIELIESLLRDDGEGAVEVVEGTMMVRKGRAAHELIRRLLRYLREGSGAPVQPGVPAWATPHEAALEREVDLDLSSGASVHSALSVLREATGAPIVLPANLDLAEVRVQLQLRQVSARRALNEVLGQADLGWSYDHGVLLVSPRHLSPRRYVLQVYDVADLLGETFPDQLEAVVINAVGEDDWDEPATISTFGRLLVVDQTAEVHQRLRDVLGRMRVARAERR